MAELEKAARGSSACWHPPLRGRIPEEDDKRSQRQAAGDEDAGFVPARNHEKTLAKDFRKRLACR